MDFLSAAMLWGAAAAAIPVVIHLTGRAQPVVHRFPAMRFLIRSHRSSTRALRIKHLLLLLLRMLAIVILVGTLARPLWPSATPGASALAGRVRGEFVLVMDASMSMSAREDEAERFELARRQALRFLDRLAPESRASLVLATEDPEYREGRLTLDHDRLRAALREARPGGRGLDLARSLFAARAILDREPAGEMPRAILFFTDLQANAIRAAKARVGLTEAGEKNRPPPLVLVDVGSDEPRNGAVLAARLPGQTVAAGQPLTLSGQIRTVDPQRVSLVDLFLDGRKVDQKPLDPRGASVLDVEFTFPAGAPGPHAGSLRLAQNDGLALDQERFIAYLAGRPPRVLLVERPEEPPAKSSGFFLRAVLESPSATSASGLAATVEPAGELHAGKLAQQQVVLLADAGNLGDASWSALSAFVEEGGGLFLWLGPRTDPALLRRFGYSEFSPHRGLLPGKIESTVRQPEARSLRVRIAQPGHPVLARFTPGLASVLRDVQVLQHVQVRPEAADPTASVILELSDGSPLLLEKTYGRGRVMLFTIGPGTESSTMPKMGEAEVFVSLVLDACRLLAGRAEDAAARLGYPLTLSIPDPPPDRSARWKPPGDALAVSLRLEADAGTGPAPAPEEKGEAALRPGTLVTPRIETPGIHRLSWKDRGGAQRQMLIAANPEANESDLARATAEETLEALKPWPASVVREVERAEILQGSGPAGRELPVPLLLLVLAVLAAESFLSNRLYKQETERAPQ